MFTYHEATTVAALRMEKYNIFNRQNFAIKIVQIIKYKISCGFKKWLLICITKPLGKAAPHAKYYLSFFLSHLH